MPETLQYITNELGDRTLIAYQFLGLCDRQIEPLIEYKSLNPLTH
jgi:hypothetical protein